MLDYRQLRLYSPIVLGLSCLGLLVVLTPLGSIVNGAKSWITLPGGFQIEPSEYAKLSVILVGRDDPGRDPAGRDQAAAARAAQRAIGFSLIPLVLVLAEPDLGVVMLHAGHADRPRRAVRGPAALAGGLLAAGVLGVTAVIKLHLLKAYQVSRLTSFLHPSADPRGTGYSAFQSKIAIGSGGLHGQGLFHGQLVAGGFVPEQHTDFIFAVAGEEIGFIGEMVIIALLAVVLLRAFRIAARADDQFGMLVASGHRDLVRGPVVHQHRHDDRHHAGHRPAAAVRLLRRLGHLRRHDRGRLPPGGVPAENRLQLTPTDRGAP